MPEELTGRALDAMVAEKVMGWKWFVHPEEPRAFLASPKSLDQMERMGWLPDDGREAREMGFSIPAYSSTWEGLGLVVDEMERRKWAWKIQKVYRGEGAADGHYALFTSGGQEGYSLALTAPEAVARAALKALGEVNDD